MRSPRLDPVNPELFGPDRTAERLLPPIRQPDARCPVCGAAFYGDDRQSPAAGQVAAHLVREASCRRRAPAVGIVKGKAVCWKYRHERRLTSTTEIIEAGVSFDGTILSVVVAARKSKRRAH